MKGVHSRGFPLEKEETEPACHFKSTCSLIIAYRIKNENIVWSPPPHTPAHLHKAKQTDILIKSKKIKFNNNQVEK